MPRPGPNEVRAIELRRAKVSALMARGIIRVADIMARIGADSSLLRTIQRDIVVVREEWHQARIEDMDKHVARKLAEIRAVREEAREAWERSKIEIEVKRRKNRKSQGDESETTSEEEETRKEPRDGDPRFLAIMLDCDRQERELLIPKEVKVKHSGDKENPIQHEHTHSGTISVDTTSEEFKAKPAQERLQIIRDALSVKN